MYNKSQIWRIENDFIVFYFHTTHGEKEREIEKRSHYFGELSSRHLICTRLDLKFYILEVMDPLG